MKSLALVLLYSPLCCSKPVFLSFFSGTEKKGWKTKYLHGFLPYSNVYRNEKQKRAFLKYTKICIYSQLRSWPRVRVNQLSFALSYKAIIWKQAATQRNQATTQRKQVAKHNGNKPQHSEISTSQKKKSYVLWWFRCVVEILLCCALLGHHRSIPFNKSLLRRKERQLLK